MPSITVNKSAPAGFTVPSPSSPRPAIAVGARVVEDRADFVSTRAALEDLFAPVPLPNDFVPGASLFDTLTGSIATVVGVAPMPDQHAALFLQSDNLCGAVPFAPGEAFLVRWKVVPPESVAKLLTEGATFTVPDFSSHKPDGLALTPLVAPFPVDLWVMMQRLGLLTGTVLQASAGGLGACYRTLGLRYFPHSQVVALMLEELEGEEIFEAAPGQSFSVLKLFDRQRLQPVRPKTKSVDHAPRTRIEGVPLCFDTQYRLNDKTLMLLDVDPERCQQYFDMVPGNVLDGNYVALGIRPVPAQSLTHVEMMMMKLDSNDSVPVPRKTVSVHPSTLLKVRPVPVPRPSLGRSTPTQFTRQSKVPPLEQRRGAYNFNFHYFHRSRQVALFDTEAGFELAGYKLGQRFQDDMYRFSTFIGVAVDMDGKIEYMFEVDGVAGAGAYSEGTKLRMYAEIVPVEPVKMVTFTYSAQALRPSLPLTLSKFYKIGKLHASANDLDCSDETCEQYFGVRPGQRLDWSFTVIGCRLLQDKVHLFFHEDGHDGATIFSSTVRFSLEIGNTVAVAWEPGTPLAYETKPLDAAFPLRLERFYNGSDDIKKRIRMNIDTSEAASRHYFGLRPGMRVDGNSTYLGVMLGDGKVRMAGAVDGQLSAGLYTEGTTLLLNDTGASVEDVLVEYEGATASFVYKKMPVDPEVPVKPTFPYTLGLRESYVSLLDVDPRRCRHYFGVVPGQRVNSNATCAGMKVERKTGLVEMYFHVDGSPGAGVYNEGTLLVLDPVIKRLRPSKPLVPLPNGPTEEITVPELPQDPKLYNFRQKYVTSGRNTAIFDIDYMEKQFGWKHGERYRLEDGPYSTLIGVACEKGGEIYCFWAQDGNAGPGIYRPGTKLLRYPGTYYEVRPVVDARTIVYHKQPQRQGIRVIPNTSVLLGLHQPEHGQLDTDPERCRAYFGIVPGDRIDRSATALGIRIDDSQMVEMWFLVDGMKGGGTYSEGTTLTVEDAPASLPRSQSSMTFGSPTTSEKPDHYHPVDSVLAPLDDEYPVADGEFIERWRESASFLPLIGSAAERWRNVKTAVSDDSGEASDETQNQSAALEGLKAAGFPAPEETLQEIARYVTADAPIAWWFYPFQMIRGKPLIEWMTEDVALRGVAEGLGGRISADAAAIRLAVEDKLFDDAYDGAAPWERVKLGLLNVFNDPAGPHVPGGAPGDCFLVLNRGVRARTTVAHAIQGLGEPVLGLLSGPRLDRVIAAAVATTDDWERFGKVAHGRMGFSSANTLVCLEAHVHGNVWLERFISHLVIHPKFCDRVADLQLLYSFCVKTGCYLITTAVLKRLADMRLWTAKRMLEYINEERVDVSQHVAFPTLRNVLLTAPPRSAAQTKYFDYIVRHHSMAEMHRLSKILDATSIARWEEPTERPGAEQDPVIFSSMTEQLAGPMGLAGLSQSESSDPVAGMPDEVRQLQEALPAQCKQQ